MSEPWRDQWREKEFHLALRARRLAYEELNAGYNSGKLDLTQPYWRSVRQTLDDANRVLASLGAFDHCDLFEAKGGAK